MAHPEPLRPARRSLLVQAPVKALDEDGVGVAVVGTLGFLVATILCMFNDTWLQQTGHEWWLWAAITGTAIGVLFVAFCIIRKSHAHAR